MNRVVLALALALLGSCQSSDGAKYPQGLKEVLPDVYSRSFADALTVRSLTTLTGQSFLESSDVIPYKSLRPGVPLCTGADLSTWRTDLNSCVVVEMVQTPNCLNRDGCAQLKLSEPLSSPEQLEIVFETLERPCEYFPNYLDPNYKRMQFWLLPGLRRQIGASRGTLRCLLFPLKPTVSSYEPDTMLVTVSF